MVAGLGLLAALLLLCLSLSCPVELSPPPFPSAGTKMASADVDVMQESEQMLKSLDALQTDHAEMGDEGAMSLASGEPFSFHLVTSSPPSSLSDNPFCLSLPLPTVSVQLAKSELELMQEVTQYLNQVQRSCGTATTSSPLSLLFLGRPPAHHLAPTATTRPFAPHTHLHRLSRVRGLQMEDEIAKLRSQVSVLENENEQ